MSGNKVALTSPPCQAISDSHTASGQGKSLSLLLRFLREAIDESNWKHDALALELGLPRKTGAAYLSRMLSGEKPWTLRHLVSLPDDIEARFAEKWAKHRGAVVVAPLTGRAAVEALVGGLVGVLAVTQFPERAAAMVKSELPAKRRTA